MNKLFYYRNVASCSFHLPIRSIELVASRLADAILEGKANIAAETQASSEGADSGGGKKSTPRARGNVKPTAVKS